MRLGAHLNSWIMTVSVYFQCWLGAKLLVPNGYPKLPILRNNNTKPGSDRETLLANNIFPLSKAYCISFMFPVWGSSTILWLWIWVVCQLLDQALPKPGWANVHFLCQVGPIHVPNRTRAPDRPGPRVIIFNWKTIFSTLFEIIQNGHIGPLLFN